MTTHHFYKTLALRELSVSEIMIIFNTIPSHGCGAVLLHSWDYVRCHWCPLTGIYNQTHQKRLFTIFSQNTFVTVLSDLQNTQERRRTKPDYRNVRRQSQRQSQVHAQHGALGAEFKQGLLVIKSSSLFPHEKKVITFRSQGVMAHAPVGSGDKSMWELEGRWWTCDCTDSDTKH